MEKLKNYLLQNRLLCLELTAEPEKIPDGIRGVEGKSWFRMQRFFDYLINAVHGVVYSFVFNLSEFPGSEGLVHLERLCHQLNANKRDKAFIIINTSASTATEKSAEFFFSKCHADGIIVNPYYGFSAFLPFVKRQNKLVLVAARTEGLDSSFFQEFGGDLKMYEHVSRYAGEQHEQFGNIGLYVESDDREVLLRVRNAAPAVPMLVKTADDAELVKKAEVLGSTEGKFLLLSALHLDSKGGLFSKSSVLGDSIKKRAESINALLLPK